MKLLKFIEVEVRRGFANPAVADLIRNEIEKEIRRHVRRYVNLEVNCQIAGVEVNPVTGEPRPGEEVNFTDLINGPVDLKRK